MRRFVIGDIHGAHRAMMQCFERSAFNKQEDLLISLGDLCDGWPDVDKVFEELLDIRNLVLLLGNHDQWLFQWFKAGETPGIWLMQGGTVTIKSFSRGVKDTDRELLENAKLYYILENLLFVHGGILTDRPLDQQDKEVFLWDRSLVKSMLYCKSAGTGIHLTTFDTVYLGHTPTINFNEDKPITACGVCLMDTGAGWPGGVLSMMDLDQKTIYQSDKVDQLYREFKGRNA